MQEADYTTEPRVPTRREILIRALRKLASPGDLRRYLEFKLVSGNEYPYFDFADQFPRLASLRGRLARTRVDLDTPVLIAGLRRSGTTLFYRLMNANSALFLFNERFPGDRLNGRGVSSRRNIYSIEDPERFRRIALRYLSPQVRSGFRRWGSKLALELAHTDPGSVSVPAMHRILAAFPGAVVLAITRDPRDFVLSALNRGGHDVQWWIDEYLHMAELYDGLSRSRPARFTTVRYEDLLEQPSETIGRCCEFCGLPYEPRMLDPGQWSVKGPQEYASGGIVAQGDKWRSARGEALDVVRRAEAACFPAAARLGYARSAG